MKLDSDGLKAAARAIRYVDLGHEPCAHEYLSGSDKLAQAAIEAYLTKLKEKDNASE